MQEMRLGIFLPDFLMKLKFSVANCINLIFFGEVKKREGFFYVITQFL